MIIDFSCSKAPLRPAAAGGDFLCPPPQPVVVDVGVMWWLFGNGEMFPLVVKQPGMDLLLTCWNIQQSP